MDQLTEALRAVIERFGDEVLLDAARLRGLLNDELGDRGVTMPTEVTALTRLIDPSLVSTLRDEPPSADMVTHKAQSAELSEADVTRLLTTLRAALSGTDGSDDVASPDAPSRVSGGGGQRQALLWVAVVAIIVVAAVAVAAALNSGDDPAESAEAGIGPTPVAATATVASTPTTIPATPTPAPTVRLTPAPTVALTMTDIANQWAQELTSNRGFGSVLIAGFSDQGDCDVVGALADALGIIGTSYEGWCVFSPEEMDSAVGLGFDSVVFVEVSDDRSLATELDLDSWADAMGVQGRVLLLRWPDELSAIA